MPENGAGNGAGNGENDGDRTHDTQGHNLVLYQLSYILRRNLCLHDSRHVCNLQEHLL